MSQSNPPRMNTAPKILTREMVLVLGWKICAMRDGSCHHLDTVSHRHSTSGTMPQYRGHWCRDKAMHGVQDCLQGEWLLKDIPGEVFGYIKAPPPSRDGDQLDFRKGTL